MTTDNNYTPTDITFSDFDGFSGKTRKREFKAISDCLIDSNIYVPLEPEKKYTTDTGWNKKTNLLTKEKAKDHIQAGGNIAIVLGKWFNGKTYVAFDVDKEGILPENLKAIVDSHAVETHNTLHDNSNRILKVEDKETYQALRSLGESHSTLSTGNETDLEILTAGSCVIPPSVVSHTECTKEKPCNQKGKDGYSLLSTNPEAPTVDRNTVEEIADILGKELQENQEPDYTEEVDENVPSPTPKFNIQEEYENNVPSVNQSFKERMNYMKFGDWKGQQLFIKLWNGNFEDINGSQKQGKGELKLANYIGFFYGNNENMVRLCMDMLPYETNYEKYESHRKTLLEYATSVDWCYCEEVRLEKKYTIANYIWLEDTIAKEELINSTEVSHDTVERVTDILVSENMIERDYKNGKRIYINKSITKGKLERLDNIALNPTEEENNNEQIDGKTSNVQRSMI